MIRFRFYLRSLQASMASCLHIKNREDLCKKINDRYGKYGRLVKPEELKCEYYGFDKPTGWNTYIISVDEGVIGMTDEEI